MKQAPFKALFLCFYHPFYQYAMGLNSLVSAIAL
jgi:hypothetical protein